MSFFFKDLIIFIIKMDSSNWTPRSLPISKTLYGSFIRLEPLDISTHENDIISIITAPDAEERFKYLNGPVSKAHSEIQAFMNRVKEKKPFVIIDQKNQEVVG